MSRNAYLGVYLCMLMSAYLIRQPHLHVKTINIGKLIIQKITVLMWIINWWNFMLISVSKIFYPIDRFWDLPYIFKVSFLELWAQKSPLQSHLHTQNLPAASISIFWRFIIEGFVHISFTSWFIEHFIAKNVAKMDDFIFVFMEVKHRYIHESLCQNVKTFI